MKNKEGICYGQDIPRMVIAGEQAGYHVILISLDGVYSLKRLPVN